VLTNDEISRGRLGHPARHLERHVIGTAHRDATTRATRGREDLELETRVGVEWIVNRDA
jgi:hypothetical protein